MSDFVNRFSSKKQHWCTPAKLFDELNREFAFTIDLAADADNSKCQSFFSECDDAMTKTWNGTCWLNPPYGCKKNPTSKWMKECFERTIANDRLTVVALVPARTNTKWFAEYCMRAKEVRFICGRPKFGDSPHGLPQPLAIVVFQKTNQTTKFSTVKLL